MEFCDYHPMAGDELPKVLYDGPVCPLCVALQRIDDLGYDEPYYHELITKLTENMEKHPEGYEGFCRCKYCHQTYEGEPKMYGCDCKSCLKLGYSRAKELDKNYKPNIKDEPHKLARYKIHYNLVKSYGCDDTYMITKIDEESIITLTNIYDYDGCDIKVNYEDFKKKFKIKKGE
jgi:hypothetical protein